jgi:hypothetical protein
VLKALTAEGLRSRRGGKLSQQSIKGMLNSRAYVGEVFSPKWGMEAKGDFLPLVSREVFDRVQLVLAGRSPVAVPHSRDREEFPLRGLLLCSKCLKPVTASTSTGEYHSKHRYFRCHRVAGHLNVKAELVEDAFLALLDKLAPNPARMPLLEAVFRKVWEAKTHNVAADREALQRELDKLVAGKERMLQHLAQGHVSGEDYAKQDRETSSSLSEIRQRLEILEMENLDIDAAIAYLSHLLWNARNIWESSDLQGKQRLQRLIFPKGLVVEKTGFGTPVTNSIFILLAGLLGVASTTEEEMVRPRRFELLTYSFGGCRSIQLSYGRTLHIRPRLLGIPATPHPPNRRQFCGNCGQPEQGTRNSHHTRAPTPRSPDRAALLAHKALRRTIQKHPNPYLTRVPHGAPTTKRRFPE